MGLNYQALQILLTDKELANRKDYQKSGKEYVKRLYNICKDADIPEDELKKIMAMIQRYSQIDVVATSVLSKDGVGTIGEERTLLNSIVNGLNKYYDSLNHRQIFPDQQYTENGETKTYKDSFVIVSNMLHYFEGLQRGSLKADLVERKKLEDNPNAKTEATFIDARGKKFELASSIDYEQDIRDVPLFSHDPSPSDIKQYGLGDCYLLAGLSELALREPQAIKDSIRDNLDGTATVRFWQRIENTSSPNAKDFYKPVYVTVDKKTPRISSSQDCCWTQILERAYVASGLHMTDGLSIVYNKPTPKNIQEMYEQYKAMDPVDRPTYQECPWLFDVKGNLHEPKLSYGSIEAGMVGPFLASFMGENYGYTRFRPKDYISPALPYRTSINLVISDLCKDFGIPEPKPEDVQFGGLFVKKERAMIEYKLMEGKDADCSVLFDDDGNIKRDFHPWGGTQSPGAIFSMVFDSSFGNLSNPNFTTLKQSIAQKSTEMRAMYKDIIGKDGLKVFDTIYEALFNKLDKVTSRCLGEQYTGNYADSALELYQKIDDLTRVNQFCVTAGTYGESDKIDFAGIYNNHAYSILGVKEKEVGGKTLKFVEVRNPHGETGRKYNVDTKGKIFPVRDNQCKDGTFLVELTDFMNEYSNIDYNSPITEYSHIDKKDTVTPQLTSKYTRISMDLLQELKNTDSYFSNDSEQYKMLKDILQSFEITCKISTGHHVESVENIVAEVEDKANEYIKHLMVVCYPNYLELVNKKMEPKELDMSKLSTRQKERLKVAKAVKNLKKIVKDEKSRDPKASLIEKIKSKYATTFIESKEKDPAFKEICKKYKEDAAYKEKIVEEFGNSALFKKMTKNIGFTKLTVMEEVSPAKIAPLLKNALSVKEMERHLPNRKQEEHKTLSQSPIIR